MSEMKYGWRNSMYSGALFLLMAVIVSCGKPALIEKSKPFPGIVREFRHITLYGDRAGMINTGIQIQKGDIYSLMATGSLDLWPVQYGSPSDYRYHDVNPEHGWVFLARIAGNHAFTPLWHTKGTIREARVSGPLYLGVRDGKVDVYGKPLNPSYYDSNEGAFSVYIIVWNSGNYVQIAEFMEQLVKTEPDNEGLADALRQTEQLEKFYLAERETTQAIAQTKEEIKELKKSPPAQSAGSYPKSAPETQKPKGTAAGSEIDEQEKIAELQQKLLQLSQTMHQLDEIKKELARERQKSDQLQAALQKKEVVEKNLRTRISKEPKTPPLLILATPASSVTRTEMKQVLLSGAAEDDKGKLTIKIYLNGKLLPPDKLGGAVVTVRGAAKYIEFSAPVPLAEGENRIRVEALDTDGLSSHKSVVVHRLEKKIKIWAVIIGINDYPKVRKLDYAVNDAKAIHDFLVHQNGLPPENVYLLLDEQAVLTKLRSILGTELKKKVAKEDMVIIYFAGHGASESDSASFDGDGLSKYLLPYDADQKDLYSTALPMREIAHIFHRIKSQRLIFLVDACYSGASGGRGISFAGLRSNISEKFLERITAGRGKVIISASGPNEVSAEDEALQHGIFTYYLLKGLRGAADVNQDHQITVDEAYQYVSRHVSNATGQEQHPIKKGVVEGKLILSVTTPQ